MKKVAIVGVEGSGKTVMLAGLGDLYTHPDEEGYFLAPKNFGTAAYVADKIERMRRGEWPVATAGDEMQGLDWALKRRQGDRQRPKDICEVSCLDFAGEVYRLAFGIRQGRVPDEMSDEVRSLKDYIRNADDLIVLINLRDIIVRGVHEPRVQESMWITNEILSYALDATEGRKAPRASIVLSQADSYADTIKACQGPQGVLAKYLPHVANNYSWLDILSVSAVDKTTLDDDGNVVPAPDFTAKRLLPVVRWILDDSNASCADNHSDDAEVAVTDAEKISRCLSQYRCDDIFLSSSPKFPAKLRNMASVIRSKCNSQLSPDDAVAILDCTVFGSAKNGVLFCRTGFYALNGWEADEHTGFVSWADFLQHGNVREVDRYELHLCDSPNVGINLSGCDFNPSRAAAIFRALKRLFGDG